MDKIIKSRQIGCIVYRSFRSSYTKLTPQQSVEDGILVSQSVFKEFDFKDLFPNLKSSEYSLGNLVAIGAFGNLSYVSMTDMHDMNFVDSISNTLAQDVSKN